MIDPNQLTPENGFVEGCVVEIVTEDGVKSVEYFEGIIDGDAWFLDTFGSWVMTGENKCLSIRPLTGPMAIWNFAPEWAVAAIVDELGVSWVDKGEQDLRMPTEWEKLSKRPFWAKEPKPGWYWVRWAWPTSPWECVEFNGCVFTRCGTSYKVPELIGEIGPRIEEPKETE